MFKLKMLLKLRSYLLILGIIPLLGLADAGEGCSPACNNELGLYFTLTLVDSIPKYLKTDSVIYMEKNFKPEDYQCHIDISQNHMTYLVYSRYGVDTLYLDYSGELRYQRKIKKCGLQFYINDFKGHSTFRKTQIEHEYTELDIWKIKLYK